MKQSPAPSCPSPTAALGARRDGWTPDRQRRFVETLAVSRSITAAAVVGISVRSAYKLRGHPAAAFRAAWYAALVRPVAAPEPTLLEQVEARETVSRSRAGLGAGFGGNSRSGIGFTINRSIPARALVRLLDRAAARVAKAQNRAISLPS